MSKMQKKSLKGKSNIWSYYIPKFDFSNNPAISSSPWSGHIFFAYDLISYLKPKKVVELGTYTGCSIFSFAQAVIDKNLKTKLYTVDTWKGDKHSGYYGNYIFKIYSTTKNKYYKDVPIFTNKMLFDDAINLFQNETINLLHIDGLHTYEAVKHDFENWLPKVNKKNGVILLHDISETKEDFGIYKLWDELKKKYQTIEFQHSHGLGVLFLSKQKIFEDENFVKVFKLYYQERFNSFLQENIYNELKIKDLNNIIIWKLLRN